jgi:hypothetical protein
MKRLLTHRNPALKPASDREFVRALLRHDLMAFVHRTFQTVVPGVPFLHNWHLEVIAWHLEQCVAGKITRLIVTLPPRSLKSICASVAFPAWVLGQDPSRRIICVSYASELAAKHSRDCRRVIESGWYRTVFPKTRLNPRKNTEPEFETTVGGVRLATSIESQGRGCLF